MSGDQRSKHRPAEEGQEWCPAPHPLAPADQSIALPEAPEDDDCAAQSSECPEQFSDLNPHAPQKQAPEQQWLRPAVRNSGRSSALVGRRQHAQRVTRALGQSPLHVLRIVRQVLTEVPDSDGTGTPRTYG